MKTKEAIFVFGSIFLIVFMYFFAFWATQNVNTPTFAAVYPLFIFSIIVIIGASIFIPWVRSRGSSDYQTKRILEGADKFIPKAEDKLQKEMNSIISPSSKMSQYKLELSETAKKQIVFIFIVGFVASDIIITIFLADFYETPIDLFSFFLVALGIIFVLVFIFPIFAVGLVVFGFIRSAKYTHRETSKVKPIAKKSQALTSQRISFFCQIDNEQHPSSKSAYKCEKCSRMICVDCYFNISHVGVAVCPYCKENLIQSQ